MARPTFVKKAQKDIDGTDIKKGDSYYHWSFRRGGRQTSKTPPRRSQLTQSEFKARLYDLQDSVANMPTASDGRTLAEAMTEARDDAESELQELADMAQGSFDELSEGLQAGPTGQMMEARSASCEDAVGNLPDASEFERAEDESDEDYTARLEAEWENVVEAVNGVEEE